MDDLEVLHEKMLLLNDVEDKDLRKLGINIIFNTIKILLKKGE